VAKLGDDTHMSTVPGPGRFHDSRALIALAFSHVVDDLYLGALPAILTFLVLEGDYSYTSAAGITLAATVVSSIAQPLFGIVADRRALPWLAPLALIVVGTGVGLIGVLPHYGMIWIAAAIAGIGVAAYHPAAASAARIAAGGTARGIALFALGGNAGLALGPAIATPLLIVFGQRGTLILALPAYAMAALMITLRRRRGPAIRTSSAPTVPGRDDWRRFATLSAIVVIRSITYYGLTGLMALYAIERTGVGAGFTPIVLSTFLGVGACSTYLGGVLADRYGRLVAIRLGYTIILPGLGLFLLAAHPVIAVIGAALLGVGMYLPFAVQTTLGQEYLPNRVGTASGVTLGLAVSAGGLFAPLFGWIADTWSLGTALGLVAVLPVGALVISFRLREGIA
jgi:FSR family fosmidomycin resistance protein-like MFS transporter